MITFATTPTRAPSARATNAVAPSGAIAVARDTVLGTPPAPEDRDGEPADPLAGRPAFRGSPPQLAETIAAARDCLDAAVRLVRLGQLADPFTAARFTYDTGIGAIMWAIEGEGSVNDLADPAVSERVMLRHPPDAAQGVLAIGFADGSALVWRRGDETWTHVTQSCDRCGELAVVPVARAGGVFCTRECATGTLRRGAVDRLLADLNAQWQERRALHRRCEADWRRAHPSDTSRDRFFQHWHLPGGEEKLTLHADALRHPGLDLGETHRRQQQYGPRIGVFVLVDGSELLQVAAGAGEARRVTDWAWAPAPSAVIPETAPYARAEVACVA